MERKITHYVVKPEHRNFTKLSAYSEVFKSANESLDKWIIRRTEEQIFGGTDERVMSRKGDNQNPNPPFLDNSSTRK